ncbi:hypothetical protein GCM10009844_22690 [Nocardioides koreensis]|uniref:Uncharacterized protein n=1 Tax=Nocardioides koreensis TaxID=433651 RepID=A0ABN2ZRW8_9ACTN
MLVVKVELWPGGDGARRREIGRLCLANISNLADTSRYLAVLWDDNGEVSSVVLRGHRRADGFWPLLARAARSHNPAGTRGPIPARWQQLAQLIRSTMPR